MRGRPRHPVYADDDVFVCDFKVDKAQRTFDRLTNKTKLETINTQPYAFRCFAEKLTLKRDFSVCDRTMHCAIPT